MLIERLINISLLDCIFLTKTRLQGIVKNPYINCFQRGKQLLLYNQLIEPKMKKITLVNPDRLSVQLAKAETRKSSHDFLLIFNDKMFHLHKKVLQHASRFHYLEKSQEKVLALETDFDMNLMDQALGFLYGRHITLTKRSECGKILNISRFLGIQLIQEILQMQLSQNLDEYGIFSALELSVQYNIRTLYAKCLEQLVSLNFQQIIINKFDLLYVGKQIFEHVLKQYWSHRQRKAIRGFSDRDLTLTVKEYSSLNNVEISLASLNREDVNNPQLQGERVSFNPKKILSKVSKSVNLNEDSKQKFMTIRTLYKNHSINDHKIEDSWEMKGKEVHKLQKENNKMIASNNVLKDELNEIRSQISEDKYCLSSSSQIEDLMTKCEELTKLGYSQNEKIEKLRNSFTNFQMQMTRSQRKTSFDFVNRDLIRPKTRSAYEKR